MALEDMMIPYPAQLQGDALVRAASQMASQASAKEYPKKQLQRSVEQAAEARVNFLRDLIEEGEIQAEIEEEAKARQRYLDNLLREEKRNIEESRKADAVVSEQTGGYGSTRELTNRAQAAIMGDVEMGDEVEKSSAHTENGMSLLGELIKQSGPLGPNRDPHAALIGGGDKDGFAWEMIGTQTPATPGKKAAGTGAGAAAGALSAAPLLRFLSKAGKIPGGRLGMAAKAGLGLGTTAAGAGLGLFGGSRPTTELSFTNLQGDVSRAQRRRALDILDEIDPESQPGNVGVIDGPELEDIDPEAAFGYAVDIDEAIEDDPVLAQSLGAGGIKTSALAPKMSQAQSRDYVLRKATQFVKASSILDELNQPRLAQRALNTAGKMIAKL